MTVQPGRLASRVRILVVDDQESVCEGIQGMLEAAGYAALTALSGRTGVALLRQHAGAIRAVLLDLRLPGENASSVYDELRRLRPDLPVILITGTAEAIARQEFARTGLAGFLQKPFDMATLLRTLRAALERAGERPAREAGVNERTQTVGHRHFVRFSVVVPVVRRAAQLGETDLRGTVRNISAGGLMVEFPVQLAAESRVSLELHTRRGPLPVTGHVAWADPPGEAIRHGIAFVQPKDHDFAMDLFLSESR